MLYRIVDGSVSLGGVPVLSHVNFEIKGSEKIAVVGRNGAGKTTLLRLIAGELEMDRDDKRRGDAIVCSRTLSMGMLSQQPVFTGECTVEEAILAACNCGDVFDRERFWYEQEYDRLFTGFGFRKEDKHKRLSEFSGGEQTKIALIRLLLMKPDILLLDEPTNHLDLETVQWLEQYLRQYEHAVVMVSHDRFFLDQTAEVVYEVFGKRLERYVGNYTDYRREKCRRIASAWRTYERQREEIARLETDVERFKHKPTKASFARAKRKQIERMEHVAKPEEDDIRLFTGEIVPAVPGAKWVYTAEHLRVGYDRILLDVSLRIRRGQKIGLIGSNGVGKSTFLKTVAGLVKPIAGESSLGNHVTVGYFDQHSAEIQSEQTVLEHFSGLFPSMTEKEVRSVLGAYLFGGREAGRRICDLSGGEKARLVLAELLQSRPNFLVLDEPTNHMDIQAKETLESAFQAYTGTILFVSHDRYFVSHVAESILFFENGKVMYYPFGYEHYLEKRQRTDTGENLSARVQAEDAALIEGIRSVPKAERWSFCEPSEEQAYTDWKLRLATEKLENMGAYYARLEEKCRLQEIEWKESETYWLDFAPQSEDMSGHSGSDGMAVSERDTVWKEWHACCLQWWDIYNENE
ncbi:MAG: ATP-binding cassette domain-containing protein [Clostridiales bacterium]|nr:ATP-binding cassette domain-containing protein [Clostridiales bacterium]